jgi:NAD(P)H dehydrogenase (quinone)
MPNVTIVGDLNSQVARDIAHRIRGGLEFQGILVNLVNFEDLEVNVLVHSDGIIFGCPTIMSSPSAKFKAFMELTHQQIYNQSFKNKIAAGFTFGDALSGDMNSTIQTLSNFAAHHSMIWVPQGDIAQNEAKNSNLDVNPTHSFLGNITQVSNNYNIPIEFSETSYYFGLRIGQIVNQWSH